MHITQQNRERRAWQLLRHFVHLYHTHALNITYMHLLKIDHIEHERWCFYAKRVTVRVVLHQHERNACVL